MESFKEWSKFEKLFLLNSILLVIIVGLIFKSDLLTISCYIVGILTALLIAKGKNLGQVFGLLITVLYWVVSFKNKYYGEVFVYIILMLPMYIIGIITWIKHKNEKTNFIEINSIKKKEWIVVTLIFIPLFFLIYALLKK